MWLIINGFLALSGSYLVYNLSLSFLDIFVPFKRSILPVSAFAVIVFISKILLHASAIVHTLVIVVFCACFIYWFQRINFIVSLIGSLLTMIILDLANNIILWPLVSKTWLRFDDNFQSLNWILFNLVEVFVPTLILIINKIKPVLTIPMILKINTKNEMIDFERKK